MINHTKKCIFVHCQKCAGESIEFLISGKSDNGYNGDPYEGSPEKHFSVLQYIDKYGESIWNNYFTFAIVRNPWERVISWISYRDKRRNLYGGEINPSVIKHEVNLGIFTKNDYHNLLSLGEENKLDFIGRFENLQKDFDIVCNKIGFPKQILPHINKTKRKHYTEYYDKDTEKLISKLFSKDINYFGYCFGD